MLAFWIKNMIFRSEVASGDAMCGQVIANDDVPGTLIVNLLGFIHMATWLCMLVVMVLMTCMKFTKKYYKDNPSLNASQHLCIQPQWKTRSPQAACACTVPQGDC